MLTGSYSEEISAQSTWYRRTKLRFQYRALDFHIIIVVLLRMREKRVSCKRACVMLYLFATSVCYFQRAKKKVAECEFTMSVVRVFTVLLLFGILSEGIAVGGWSS